MVKNGRPKKEKEQIKDVVKHVRYSFQEWEEVQGKLESSGLKYSDFVRKSSARVTITPVNLEAIKTLRDLRNDLTRIGTNINQIAIHAATVTDYKSLQAFITDLRKCGDIAKELTEKLDKIRETIQ